MEAHPHAPFGAWLKEYRRLHGLTRAELGRRIGCAPETIQKIETGERRPSQQIAELLAIHLQIAPDQRAAFIEFARLTPRTGHTDLAPGPPQEEVGTVGGPTAVFPLPPGSPPYAPPTNLRVPLTRLIGRQDELRDIRAYLARGTRLLTLTGSPGIGKTRLAEQAGLDLVRLFPHGVFFVPLAPARDADALIETIVQTLGIDRGGEEPLPTLRGYLRDKQMMLILDNFEQILAAAPLVVDLLEHAPQVRAVVTSRAPLHTRGEQRYVVPPLAVPDLGDALTAAQVTAHAAVALFAERAAAVHAGFQLTDRNAAAVAAICAAVDGVPLAIELLAAHIPRLSPQDLLARLMDDRGFPQLQLMTGGPVDLPDRQRSLRAALDWSYARLTASEQTLFRRFSVFVGGGTLAAAEAICDAPGDLSAGALRGLGALLDKNLLKEETGRTGERRFAMLEPIRQYAAECLRVEDAWPMVGQWHAEYFLALAETADPQLGGADQEAWFHRLAADHHNLHAALQWLCDHAQAEPAARLATALQIFWDVQGYFTEGRRWLDRILTEFGARLPPPLQSAVLKAAGSLAQAQGDLARAADLLTQSVALLRAVDDQPGLASALTNLSLVYLDEGSLEPAAALLEEGIALYQRLGDDAGRAAALSNLGLVELYRQAYGRAVALFEQSLALRRAAHDTLGSATALCNLGEAARQQGDYARAIAFIAEALHLAQDLNHQGLILACLGGLATIAVSLDHPLRAAQLFGAEEALREALAAPLPVADLEEYTQFVSRARAMTDEAAFRQAWEQGRRTELPQILAQGLDPLS